MQKSLLVVFLLAATCISGCGGRLFYMPREYHGDEYARLLNDPAVIKIHYRNGDNEQTAFYMCGAECGEGKPGRVWLLFGGINSLALDWYQWFGRAAGKEVAFLLIDFPGYGLNEGLPRAKRMFASSFTAFEALASYLHVSTEELGRNLGVLGHSLGTGVAMDFACRVSVKRLVLISPFTSLDDLIVYRYGDFGGAILNLINPEEYENETKLRCIANQPSPPDVVILHGTNDRVIPVEMGRRLAGMYPALIAYDEIEGFGHTNLFAEKLELVFKSMQLGRQGFTLVPPE